MKMVIQRYTMQNKIKRFGISLNEQILNS